MPKALLVVPCETVIVGQGDAASLINLISEIQYGNIPEILPPDTALPLKWTIFAEWSFTHEESQLLWEQRLRLLDSSGNATTLQHVAEMVPLGGKPRHRMIAQMGHFPVVPTGDYQVEVSVKEVEAREWTAFATYPIIVKRTVIITNPIIVPSLR